MEPSFFAVVTARGWGGVDDQPLCELPGQKLQTTLNKNNSKPTEPGPATRQPGRPTARLSVPTQIVLRLIHQRPLPGLRLTSSPRPYVYGHRVDADEGT